MDACELCSGPADAANAGRYRAGDGWVLVCAQCRRLIEKAGRRAEVAEFERLRATAREVSDAES